MTVTASCADASSGQSNKAAAKEKILTCFELQQLTLAASLSLNVCFSRLNHLLVCGVPGSTDDRPFGPLCDIGNKLAKSHIRVKLAQLSEQS